MNVNKKFLCSLFLLIFSIGMLFAENIVLTFRNQRIDDILYTLSEMEDKTINLDDTVQGTTSYNFNDPDFDTALNRFCDNNSLFINKIGDVYNISKVKITKKPDNKYDVSAEDVGVTTFIRMLSKETNVSIMSDNLPAVLVTIRMTDAELVDIIDTILYKLPGYQYEEMRGGYYIYRMSGGNSSRISNDSYKISASDGLYTVDIQKSNFQNFLNAFFKKANKEYILLFRPTATLENLKFENREFDTILNIIFAQLNLDFKEKDGVYYIFEVQKRDVLKQLKDTKTIKLENITIDKLLSIFPSDLNATNLIKTDKLTNTIYLTGSERETAPIESFIISADVPYLSGSWTRYDLKNTTADAVIPLIPKDYLFSECIQINGSNAFITLTTKENEDKLKDFIDSVDNKNKTYPIKLNYIKSDDLIKNLPPSVKKDNIFTTNDLGIVFYTGSESSLKILENFKNDKNIAKVNLSRFNVSSNRELATFQGQFSKNIISLDESMSIQDKIDYYKNYISNTNEFNTNMANGDIVSVLRNIRNTLSSNSCKEEYIQQQLNNGYIDIEFYFTSDSVSLINFLKAVSGQVGSVSSIRIRRTDTSLETTIRFKTGIEDKVRNAYSEWGEDANTSITNMSKAFNDNTVRVEKAVERSSSVSRDYTFVGTARSKGKNIAIFKNQRTSKLYKLEVVSNFNDVDDSMDACVMVNASRYTIRIDGLLFDIVKQ